MFSVSAFDIAPEPEIFVGEPWEITFESDNITIIQVYLTLAGRIDYDKPFTPHTINLSQKDHDRRRITIPAEVITKPGQYVLRVTAENKYGRLKRRLRVVAAAPEE